MSAPKVHSFSMSLADFLAVAGLQLYQPAWHRSLLDFLEDAQARGNDVQIDFIRNGSGEFEVRLPFNASKLSIQIEVPR